MFKRISTTVFILFLFSASNSFAYSTTVTGDCFGDSSMIMFNQASASFWTRGETGSASETRSGTFLISSDYGGTGTVGVSFMMNWTGWASANGVNPSASALVDFTITDHDTGALAFSFFYNPTAQDTSGMWSFANAMSGPFPPDISETFQLGTLYDWNLKVEASASASGTYDDITGTYFGPDLGGNAMAGGSMLITTMDEPAATPIPGAVWLLGSGIAGLFGLRRKFM